MGPIILVENLERSRDFYERILKQKVLIDFGVTIGETMEIVIKHLYHQGLSIDEVVRKTAMPKAFVEETIQLLN
ncbi:glyoxalase/bleomycin resistance/dioxygenase family protein [Paenibacillus typhae]|nr:glyoxalase/bleomycin resistance/dioxygenase family protein [Paenibacillus typhae]